MSELIHSASKRGDHEGKSYQRLPGEQELREFEDAQAIPPMLEYSIEEVAEDPDNPTPEELQALKDLNRGLSGETPTFEEWFGYPDPRTRDEQTAQGDQQDLTNQDR